MSPLTASSGAQEIAKAAPAGAHVSVFTESLALRPFDAGPLPMAQSLENPGLLKVALMTHSLNHTDFFLGVNMLS